MTILGRLAPLLLPVLAGCAAPTTAVQLVLTTTPDLCTPADLLAQVATVAVVVAAPGGLAGVTAPGPTEGGGTAADLDGDGVLEVLFQAPPLGGPELPILELGLAHNAGRELTFRVLGFPAGADLDPARAVAIGGVTATVAPGEVRRVGTPFNLRAAARPPKVVLALPPDGAADVPQNLRAVTVMLSTVVDAASAAAATRVLAPDGHALTLTTALDTLSYASAGGAAEQRSLLTLTLAEGLTLPGQYTIAVGPGIVSALGRRFDQDPATLAEDGFTSRFTAALTVGGGGHPCEMCTAGYECDAAETGCVPLLDCAAACAPAYVCDPAAAVCVEDCRTYGACDCDPQTGLCRGHAAPQ
ncbi:MAG TPA: hypothetical protein VGQ83_24620 [Polyangia bacterium]|jgi:hypothetical protein